MMAASFFVCGLQLLFITTHLPSYLAICGLDPMLSVEDRHMHPTPLTEIAVQAMGDAAEMGSRSMLNLDPPAHTRLRRLVSRAEPQRASAADLRVAATGAQSFIAPVPGGYAVLQPQFRGSDGFGWEYEGTPDPLQVSFVFHTGVSGMDCPDLSYTATTTSQSPLSIDASTNGSTRSSIWVSPPPTSRLG